jgi:hypothetical protein
LIDFVLEDRVRIKLIIQTQNRFEQSQKDRIISLSRYYAKFM